jgi:AraC-like DNA-binding protein
VARRLLIEALGIDSKRRGSARSAVQAAIVAQVRRYIDDHLDDVALTPASVVDALGLKRATVYRWFEDEGGLATVIRNRRLRVAANELIRYPHVKVVEIAFGLGFNSASDFTRAFRRAFDMSPLDMRVRALEMQQGNEFDFAKSGAVRPSDERANVNLIGASLMASLRHGAVSGNTV